MAIACLRLFTRPPFPERKVSRFLRRIALSTLFPAAFPYRGIRNSLRVRSSRSQSHLSQSSATHETVRIPQRFQNFKVVVALAHDKLYRLPDGLHGSGEVARLALKLGRFHRPVENGHGCAKQVKMALRA